MPRGGWLTAAGWLLLGWVAACTVGAQELRLRGEVVDPALYLKEGRHGPGMEEDTYAAMDGGQTLAFLEEASGTLYLLLAATPGEDPNELAYDYVNKPVDVTGVIYERGGLRGIVLSAVEEVASAEEPAEETPAPQEPASTPE